MMHFLACLLLASISTNEDQLETFSIRLYSQDIKDSFQIDISYFKNHGLGRGVSAVYYLDAQLNSGKQFRELLNKPNLHPTVYKSLYFGISPIPNKQYLRNRDLIPNYLNKKSNAEKFYKYVTLRIIPLMEQTFGASTNRTLIGHSLGGLFVFHALFQVDTIFRNYIALSPSLWVNKSRFFATESKFSKKHKRLPGTLYMSAGTKETMNHVLKATRRMNKILKSRQYHEFSFTYVEHSGFNHFTSVPIALHSILRDTGF